MFVFSIAVGVLIAGIVLVAVVISLCATEHAFTGRINLFDRNSLLWMNAVPVIFTGLYVLGGIIAIILLPKHIPEFFTTSITAVVSFFLPILINGFVKK